MINKARIRREGKAFLLKVENEIRVMRKLSKEGGHANVVRMISYEETRECLCMVLEYCSQGEYFELI